MACNFSVTIHESPEAILQKAKTAIESQSGIFNGDVHAGNFEVTVFGNFIKGSYTIEGMQMHLDITDKPFFVPCSMIESMLQKQLS